MRDTGLARIGYLPWGTHFCLFFDNEQDLLQILVPYFEAGLRLQEKCLWIVSPPYDLDRARALLPKDLAGSIELIDYRYFYFRSGRFDISEINELWSSKAQTAWNRGLRVFALETWLRNDEQWLQFLAYERQLGATLAGLPVLVLCAYCLRDIAGDRLLDFARSHPWTLVCRRGRWETLESPQNSEQRSALEQVVAERTAQLRSLAARLESVREEEAARIARELHDELGSTLTTLRWTLDEFPRKGSAEYVGRLRTMETLVDGLIDSVRRISADVRPPILDLGLIAAIRWQTEQFAARTGLKCSFRGPATDISLPQQHSTALFRVLQEALTNVLRHSGASEVQVELDCQAQECVMNIRDNGRGFEPGSGTGLGLLGITERVHLLGGSVDFHTAPGRGLSITVRVPLPCAY